MARKPKSGQDAHNAVNGLMEEYHRRIKDRAFHGFEKKLMDDLELLRIEPDGTVVFSLYLGQEFSHVGGSLHGGASALILDQCTTLSIAPHSAPGYWEWVGGVTRTFSVTCLRGAPQNSTVHIRCKVVSIGKTAVLMRGEITSEDETVIYNVMSHDKLHVQFGKKAKETKI